MRKFFKKRSTQILSVLLLLPLLVQSFVIPIFALDELIPETQVDIPIDISEDILDEGISDPKEIAEPTLEKDIPVPKETVKPTWVTSKESATTSSSVVLGEKYVYPNNSDVTVTFSKLPTSSSTLTISTVYLTDEQVKVTNAASNVAYDITTDMVDGTFNYDLTLPKVGESNRVVYAESVNELVDAKDISNVVENGSSLKIDNLNHFTVFVVVKPLPTGVLNGGSCTVSSVSGVCYDTIQGAINAAAISGDTIKVMAGTYSENININKSVVLEGVNGTIIKPANETQPIVTISTSGVSIKNIDIVGTGINSHGISILGGGSNTILTDVSSTYNGGNGIHVSISGVLNDIVLNNCNLSHNNIGFRTGSSSGIKGLTLTDTIADYNLSEGLYFDGPITGLNLNGGSYSHNRGSSNTTDGVGIYATKFNQFPDSEKETMLLTNFVANDNVRGVIINKFYGPFSITNAEISNNSEEGLAVGPGASVSNLLFENIKANNNPKWNFQLISYLGYTVSNVVIKDSEFNGSTNPTGYEGTGLYLYVATGSTLSNVSVTNSSMNGNRVGLYMRTVSATSIDNIVVNQSSFVGNSQYGAFNNDATRSIDLSSNWWGHNSGPLVELSNTTGKGSKIAGPVDFFPWYTDSSRTVLVTSLTQFVDSALYVKAGNSSDISAKIKVPEPTEEVRFILNGDTTNPIAGYLHLQSGFSPLNGFEHWRLKTSLPAGQYTLKAQYRVGSTWYDVAGSNLAYSIDEPWAEWVSPLPEQYFRPSDNPLRIKADDQYFQFKKVVFNINGTDYTVERASCDLRSAGSYVLCDVKSASNWAGLAEGTYRTYSPSFTSALVKAQTYTFAENRFDPNEFTESSPKTASRVFYIDGTIPTTSNFTIDNDSQYYSKSIIASVNASDDNGLLHDVTFFITEPRSTDGACDGNGTAIVSQSITSTDSDGKYRATLDTSSLNGSYCVNAQAEDASNSHSLPIERQKVVIDNTGPEAPIINYPSENQYFNTTPILNEWSEVSDSSGIAYYRIEYVYDDEHPFFDAPYRKTSDGTTTQRNHIPNIDEEGGVRFRVQAFDNAGNEGTWSGWRHYYYIDSEPIVSLVSPEDNFITNLGGFVQSWSINDFHQEHIDHYEYRSCWNNPTENDDNCNFLDEENNLTSTSRTVGKQGDKIFWWQVRAVDKAGNVGDWANARKAILDSTPPVVAITSPENNGLYKADVILSGTVTEANPHHYWLQITKDGVNLNIAGVTGEQSAMGFSTTLTEDGEYNVTFAARDAAGGTSRSGNRSQDINITFTIDQTPPEPPVLTGNPVQYVKWGNVTRTWSASSSSDVDYYIYKNITNGWTAGPYNAGLSEYSITHTTGNPDRVFEWQVVAVDYAGNETWSKEKYKVVVDNTIPTVEISNVDIADKKLSFTVSGTDNLSGARTVDTNIYNENNSGSAIIPIGRLAHDITPETLSVSYNAIDIDVSSLESGIYTIRASIMDYAGNLKYATKQIEIDNTAPETIFTNEISGIFTNDPIQIEGESTDLHGVTQVKLQYKETTDTTWTDLVILSNTSENSPFIWSYTWTPSQDGTYDIKASAMDTLENEEKSPSLYAVTYDTTPPQITLLDLVLGVLKNVTASDSSGVEKIEVSKDKITWEDYTSEMDLNDLVGNQPGTYTIYVRVTDKAGNQTVSPVTFTIPQPATTPGGQTLGARTQRTVLATTSTLTEETTETTTEEEITEEEVLGETTCEATYKISGTVYYDNNDNGIKDDNEKVVKDIKVNIYNSNKELEKTVTTDEKGYWEASLCPGEYTTQVEGAEEQSFVLGDSDTTLDISVEKKTNWWLIAVIGSAVVILLVVLADRYNKRKVS